ncbi:MAG: hypothetical protein LLG14_27265 [Nocardiaceae bacterium]|nr:hypothetical protein [Nocardiaceae bacterium]
MGPLVGGLAALGGGSAVAGGITLATAAVGVYSALEQVQAGKALAAEKKQEAVREADAARGEEIERRRGLMAVLAQRSAAAGAAGVTTDGSIGALARRDIKDNRNDLGVLNANTAARQRALRGQAKSAIRTSRAGAASSLLDSAGKLYEARG